MVDLLPLADEQAPSFPRLFARTLRFTLGVPRTLNVSPDGARVLFVRTESGTARSGALWAYDVATGEERLIARPEQLLGGSDEALSAEERSRRERSRESASGIVSYASDRKAAMVSFTLSGSAWVADVAGPGGARALPTVGPVIDPRIDPTGRHVAYASAGALRVVGADGTGERVLVEPDGDEVVWGQAEFVAAEDMDRDRGYWWAPDGESLLVERYDNTPVQLWYVADPANPEREPVAHRYPAAGTPDADVTLWLVRLDGTRTQVVWDRAAFPYLTRVSWTAYGDALVQVMTRDQRLAQILAVGGADAATKVVREQRDDVWVDLVVGVPAYGADGRLVTCEDSEDTKRVFVDGEPVSPVGMQVRAVVSVDDRGVLVTASTEPTEVQLVRIGYDGSVTELTSGSAVHNGESAGGTTVVSRGSLDADGVRVSVHREGVEVAELGNHQVYAGFRPQVTLLRAGKHELRTAVLFPHDHEPGSRRLPVVMDPYGGPHGQMVVAASRAFLESQWLADQGFCVIVADGHGTPARGPAWDRSVRDVIAEVTLADQVEALAAVAAEYPDDVDTDRVGITGWSYGGYLAALAVLCRPDVFHAAVAGAPVTDWRLYDTFYTERYVGHPNEQPEVYDATSLLPLAPRLERPLMIIHGMVDDNVVVANSLRLSSALLAAGRPHTVLPLTGVTHMTPQEVVAENLKLLQVDFLRSALNAANAP
ncbi:MAG: S9 family peptidase [Nocardioidaceae bacterium]|nr:S9 family peptidase [Nocardioidaceae bacterium]